MIGFSLENLGEKEWKRIDQLTEEKVILPADSPDISTHLTAADCILVKLGASVNKEMIDSMPNLKYIGMFGTGYGRIDTAYARGKGVAVCNIAGYSKEGVAELVFGMILDHIRELERAKSQARSGDYSEATFKGYEIKDKNFGVVGLGRNGQRVAEIAHQGFQANVIYWSKTRKTDIEQSGIKYQELNTILEQSDFLSVNLAYVPETESFFNQERINLIKPGCIIVSTVQNEVFDLKSLIERLKKNDMTFIFDHSDELTQEQAKELSRHKNCMMYPPIGYITKEATQAKLGMFVGNLENFISGKPQNVVN